MAIFGLRMTRSLHTMLTEPRARLKPNMESVDCMVQHPAESIPMLMDMIEKIKAKYTDENGEWIDTERTKTVYYKNGKEIKERNVLDAILNHDYDRKEEVTYSVNEGDISSYYMATAANAIMALKQMMVMATDNLTEKNIVWDGD